MEGYLFKKGRGQSGFLGRKNWKKRWCVLEGQFLTYYEDFNTKTQKPTEKKGMVPVRGCTVEEVNNKEKSFQFVLKHETRSPLFMSAENEKMMKTWITALDRAAKTLHDGPVSIDFTEYYQIFGLSMADNPTASQINRAYRKTCLKCHPDKGGDPNEFKRVQEAFEILQSRLEEEEEEKLYKTIYFDAVIEKGPPGVGFGMVVVEDAKRQIISVKDVLTTMNLKSITDESKGAVRKGDILVRIGDDDITGWTLTRIVQRLNDFRVPVNSDIQLRFSRRVKIEDDEADQPGSYADIDEGEPYVPPPPADQADEPSAPPVHTPGPSGGMHDIDEDEYVPSAGDAGHANRANSGWFPSVDEPEPEPGPGAAEELPEPPEEEFHAAEGDWEDVMQDPVRRATIDAAGEDLRAEFNEISRTLKDVIAQRDQLKMELDEMKDVIRQQRSEKKALLKQLELAEQDCEGAERREADAVLQLKEISYQSQQSKEEVSQMARDAAQVASLLKRSKDVPVSREFEIYLERNGYTPSNVSTPAMSAQRSALRTAAALDKTGAVLRKWSLEGDSAVEKIKKFEAKLARQQEQYSRQQMSPDRPDMKGFSSPGFEEINSQLGMHAQPHEFDENMIHMNQEVDGVNYDEYMQRVLSEQQQQAAPAPRRAPPSRPAPRVDRGDDAWTSDPSGHYQSPQHQSPQYQSPQYEPQSYQPQSYQPQSYQPQSYQPQSYQPQSYQPQSYQPQGYAPSRSLAPNPLLSNGGASSAAGGGKIMGLLERKLASRSAVRSLAPPGPTSVRRAPPPQPYGNQPGGSAQQNQRHQLNYASNAGIGGGYPPAAFQDDYSETSGSFGWQGMAH